MGCLYQLTSPNGKSYIGISLRSAEERWGVHKSSAKQGRKGAIYNAIRKYGPDNFTLTTMVVADSRDYLCCLEERAIATFNTKFPHGYNLTNGGDGLIGYEFTEEARATISSAQKARYENTDQRSMLIAQGKRASAISYANAMARRIDGKPPWQVRAEAKRTRIGSAERSRRISERVKAAMARPEVRQRFLEAMAKRDKAVMSAIGKRNLGTKKGPASEQRKQLIRERQLAAWADPERKAKRVASMKLKCEQRKNNDRITH